MSTNGFMQRRKGEELIRQRFSNLISTLNDKHQEAKVSLKKRLEDETPLPQLRGELESLREQEAKLAFRITDVQTRVHQHEQAVREQVEQMTRDLEQQVDLMQAQLRDKERVLVEQLWVDSLSADLKDLLGKVPSSENLLTNGVQDCLEKLALQREGENPKS